MIAAYLPRADPRDALVVRTDATARCLADLAPGRGRNGQPATDRVPPRPPAGPDRPPLHGNVDTRLRRLEAGETDALVLACAGLDRLGLGARIAERSGPRSRSARAGPGRDRHPDPRTDARMLGLAAAIDHVRTPDRGRGRTAAFLETSGGGCRAPIGALATIAAPRSSSSPGRPARTGR